MNLCHNFGPETKGKPQKRCSPKKRWVYSKTCRKNTNTLKNALYMTNVGQDSKIAKKLQKNLCKFFRGLIEEFVDF